MGRLQLIQTLRQRLQLSKRNGTFVTSATGIACMQLHERNLVDCFPVACSSSGHSGIRVYRSDVTVGTAENCCACRGRSCSANETRKESKKSLGWAKEGINSQDLAARILLVSGKRHCCECEPETRSEVSRHREVSDDKLCQCQHKWLCVVGGSGGWQELCIRILFLMPLRGSRFFRHLL